MRWLADPRSQGRSAFLASIDAINLESEPEVVMPESVKNEPYILLENGNYSCNFCGKSYKHLGYMKKHLNLNHELKDLVSFVCKRCNKLFDTKKQLTRHGNMKTDCSK